MKETGKRAIMLDAEIDKNKEKQRAREREKRARKYLIRRRRKS